MFPFFLLMGLAGLLVLSSKRGGVSSPEGKVTITSATATRAGAQRMGLMSADERYVRRIAAIRMLVKNGRPVPRMLLDDTITEAYERGDWKVVSVLTPGDASEARSEEASNEEKKSEPEGPAEDASKPLSPIDAATVEEWDELLDKLKTESPDYSTDKHVGAFHHNRERLAQLSIDAGKLTDEESQRKALADDLVQYRVSERKLIDDFGGDLVELNGQTMPVTMSGVLGVLKAAGPRHARSWFKNAEEREQFPKTTETFLKTNGIF